MKDQRPETIGAMTRAVITVVTVCLLLGGCASGSKFSESALPSLSPERARLVFIREPHFAQELISARIEIDGNTVGKLDDGSVLYMDHSPGSYTISADFALSPGSYAISADLRPGQTYFFEVSPRSDFATASLFGYIGECVNSCGNEKTGGPYQIEAISREQAEPKLDGLTLQPSE